MRNLLLFLFLMNFVYGARIEVIPSDVYAEAFLLKERVEHLREEASINEKFPHVKKQFNKESRHVLQKSLECRQADIQKAEETGLDYFIKLLGDVSEAKKDVIPIKKALIKINQYSQ